MKLKWIAVLTLSTTMLVACGGGGGGSSSNDDGGSDKSTAINLANARKVLNTNADIAYAAYSDAVATAEALQAALATFRANPTQENLDAAKKAWLVAREPYGQTEVYRFRLSPIDSTNYADENGPEGDINAWPLGEALIDYVTTGGDFTTPEIGVTAHDTGVNGNNAIDADNHDGNNIIATTAIEINEDLLSRTATAEDERDVISGYHAIEFLLWGQDLNNDAEVTNGDDRDEAVKTMSAPNLAHGGQRPVTDFQPGYDGVTTTYDSSEPSHRRHKYLEVAVAKLIADLKTVRDAWADGAAYRTAFTTINNEQEAKQKLTEILTGMGTLSEGELAGERMQIAFSSNSQEDEHSCFSDNTHRDIWLNAEGVANSYYGEYAGYDSTLDGVDNEAANAVVGYGIDDYLADAGLTDIATQLDNALKATEQNYKAIDQAARTGSPVDVLVMDVNRNVNNPMYKTIASLREQSVLIAQLAEELGIDDTVVDDDATGCDTSKPDQPCE